jgi:hypothetical protein
MKIIPSLCKGFVTNEQSNQQTPCRRLFWPWDNSAVCSKCGEVRIPECPTCKKPITTNFCQSCGEKKPSCKRCGRTVADKGEFCGLCAAMNQIENPPAFAGEGANDTGQPPEPWWLPQGAWCVRREWVADSERRVFIRPGTRAMVFTGENIADVTGQAVVGHYEISGDINTIRNTSGADINRAVRNKFGTNHPPLSILLVDASPQLISFSVSANTLDSIQAEVSITGEFVISNLTKFLQLLGTKNSLTLEDVAKHLLGSNYLPTSSISAFGTLLADMPFDDLCTEDGQNALTKRLSAKLQSQLQSCGLEVQQWWVHVSTYDPLAKEREEMKRGEYQVRTFLQAVHLEDKKEQVLLEAKSLNLQRLRESRGLDVQHEEISQDLEERVADLSKKNFDRALRGDEFEAAQLGRKAKIREQLRDYRNSLGEADLAEGLSDAERQQRFVQYLKQTEKHNNVTDIINEDEIRLLSQTLSNKREFSHLIDQLNYQTRLRQEELDQEAHDRRLRQERSTEAISTASSEIDFKLATEQKIEEQKIGLEGKRFESEFERKTREQREALEQQRLNEQHRLEALKEKAKLAQEIARSEQQLQIETDEHEAATLMRLKEQTHRQSLEAQKVASDAELNKTAQEKMFELERIAKMANYSPEQIALLSNSSAEAIQAIVGMKNNAEQMNLMQSQMQIMAEAAAAKAKSDELEKRLEREKEIQQQQLDMQKGHTTDLKEAYQSAVEQQAGRSQKELEFQKELHEKELEREKSHSEQIQTIQERENARLDDQNERYVDAQTKHIKRGETKSNSSTPKVNINIESDKTDETNEVE